MRYSRQTAKAATTTYRVVACEHVASPFGGIDQSFTTLPTVYGNQRLAWVAARELMASDARWSSASPSATA